MDRRSELIRAARINNLHRLLLMLFLLSQYALSLVTVTAMDKIAAAAGTLSRLQSHQSKRHRCFILSTFVG